MTQLNMQSSAGFRSRLDGPAELRKAHAAVAIGNFVEWFDFAIYGYFAAIIGRVFFPSAEPGISLLSSLAVFAVGFVSRPLGALIFGPLGDRYGRKPVLATTIAGMGLVTALIGLLPGYASIGIAAPILLIILRFLQGMMVGGEWTSAGIFIVESAPPDHRAVAASLVTCTAGLAYVAGTSTAVVLSATLSDDTILSWGWRLPFLSSVVLAAIGLYIRRELDETPVFNAIKLKRSNADFSPASLRDNVRALTVSLSFSSLFGVSLYYLLVYAANHLSQTVGLSRVDALWPCAVALTISVAANPVFGYLSDAFGRRPLVLASAAGLSLFGYPLFLILNTSNISLILIALTMLGILVAMEAVMNVILLVEVFPASIRSSGAAIGHNLALALLAGPSPLIGAGLVYMTGDANAPGWYLALISIICFFVLWFLLPETRGKDIAKG
ncbi:Proline/betaine transporter [Starkeya nomas]|uniref:Proline/betaine transporter n=1 Tax=Starkeya nomas TaxID=2666134 RepID=A0A5S9Q3P7_9HYPH|nr:MFS transporter [Starkeya nomas]CAA0112278.1 Proline/betaine transporter [Starkeya nomas]